MNTPAYKIASPELIDIPLIEKVASTKKPVILSTGASSLQEIDEAVSAARSKGCEDLILLHCTAAYPAPIEDANLASLLYLARKYNTVVGLSDHTPGTIVSELSVVLGSSFIEKHFTLARSDGGVDSEFSLEPEELCELVQNLKKSKDNFGSEKQKPSKSESSVILNRRSLYVVNHVKKGELFTENNIRSVRPAKGLKPKYYNQIIGKKATRRYSSSNSLALDMVN